MDFAGSCPPLPSYIWAQNGTAILLHTCLVVACCCPERGKKQPAGDIDCASAHPVVGDADCSHTASARAMGDAGSSTVLGRSVVSDSLRPCGL